MFQAMHSMLAIDVRLASRDQAERRLTNLGQLGEILQRQSRGISGTEALLAWFRRQVHADVGEENELRLESDSDLVKISTIHGCKGLEYPIVFLPFPWLCQRAGNRAQWVRFHEDGETFFSVGQSKVTEHRPLAEKERLAEDLRLLYVALTRAKAKIYLIWGNAGSGNAAGLATHSALGWLLHSDQSPEDLEHELPLAFPNNTDLAPALDKLAQNCSHIEVIDLPDARVRPIHPDSRIQLDKLEARTFHPSTAPAWRIGSFSALTRDVHQVRSSAKRIVREDRIFDFPAGNHIGLLLHAILERVDFTNPEPELAELILDHAPRYGLMHEEQLETLAHWIREILHTDLDHHGLQLSKLSTEQCLNELSFDFSIEHFDTRVIDDWLQDHTSVPLQPLSGAEFCGLITGAIDLIFEHNGKFYLVDYKSNHLGNTLKDYRPEQLAQAMLDRRYDLQSWLYTLALHRYLQQRLPNYDYANHFGGCYYLFLRGLRIQQGPDYGVHFHRPDHHQLIMLEQILGQQGSVQTRVSV